MKVLYLIKLALLISALIISTNCLKSKNFVLQMPPPTILPSNNNFGTCLTGKYYSEREPALNSWCAENCSPDCDITANGGFPSCIIRNRGCAPNDPIKLCNCFNYYDSNEIHIKCSPKGQYSAIVGQGIWCVNNCCPTCDLCKQFCDCIDQGYRVPLFAPGLMQQDESGEGWDPNSSANIVYQ